MAKGLGVIGHPNTGKSFARTFIEHGDKCFVLSPSAKFSYLTDKNDKVLPRLDFSIGGSDWAKLAEDNSMTKKDVIDMAVNAMPEGTPITTSGNHYIVEDLTYVVNYLKFIDKHMPHIKVIFLADFTHWVSSVISNQKFIRRKSGGEAFARFWDLAADILNNVLKAIEKLERQDLIVVTEFHAQVPDEVDETNELYYDIFLPAGKMLNKSFLPKSYFDYMLFTDVEKYEWDDKTKQDNESTRYKFVVNRQEPFDGRMANLFADIAVRGRIPNDMQLVLNRVRKHLGMDAL